MMPQVSSLRVLIGVFLSLSVLFGPWTPAARGESPASHRGRRGAPLIHPTAQSPRRGDPGGAARRPQSGAPTVRLVHGGVQYREYLKEQQRSQPGAPAARFPARWGGCVGLFADRTRQGPFKIAQPFPFDIEAKKS